MTKTMIDVLQVGRHGADTRNAYKECIQETFALLVWNFCLHLELLISSHRGIELTSDNSRVSTHRGEYLLT